MRSELVHDGMHRVVKSLNPYVDLEPSYCCDGPSGTVLGQQFQMAGAEYRSYECMMLM